MSQKRLRILWTSNAMWAPSGYAQQMFDLLPLLRDEGYNMGIVCFYGLEGGKINLDGITCYPRLADVWGADAVVNHQEDFKADVVISFQDTWVLDPNLLRQFKNWIPMAPIDHDPCPPAVFDRLKLAYRVITHSLFGQKDLLKKGMHSTYIPLLVDTDVFSPQDKNEIRKQLGIPNDVFLFGMVSANKDNPPRKSFQEVMDAFARFHKNHPKSGLYLHTILNQQGGFPIDQYAKFLGIEKCIYNIPPYDQLYRINKPKMAKIYSMMDCLIAPSTNEGFGVPIIEAQSCGVPVITNNFTAMPELIIPEKTGLLTDVLYKRFTPLLSYIGVPSAQSIYEQMEKIFKADRVAMGKSARKHIQKNYDLKTIVREQWIPFLEKIEHEIYKD